MSIQAIGNSAQIVQPPVTDRVAGTGAPSFAPNAAQTDQAVAAPSSATVPNTTTPLNPATDPAEVNKAVQALNKALQSTTPDLLFSIDDDSKRLLVKLVDQETKQVLIQIPSEEVLDIAKAIDKFQGLLVKLKV